jgi:hypothetical protein
VFNDPWKSHKCVWHGVLTIALADIQTTEMILQPFDSIIVKGKWYKERL